MISPPISDPKMKITVPPCLGYPESASLFQLQASTSVFGGSEIHLDCAVLRYVDPLGLCVLHHWFKDLEARDVAIYLDDLPLSVERWLRRMNVFRDLSNLRFKDRTSWNSRNDHRGNLIEVRLVSSERDVDRTAEEIANAIAKDVPDMSWQDDGMRAAEGETVSAELSYVFSELLNNALTHGRGRGYPESSAKIAAQYYPTPRKLRIAIVDNGCGLLESLSGHSRMEGEMTDNKAIRLALEPRISCNRDVGLRSDSKNQGLGLTISTKMALSSGGEIGIFTGRGRLKQSSGENLFFADMERWQGTAVYLEFDRQGLAEISRATIMESIPGYAVVSDLNFG